MLNSLWDSKKVQKLTIRSKEDQMKNYILCGLAFFAFVFVSCGKQADKPTVDPKAECEQKKDTHVWNETTKSCDPKPAESLDRVACVKDPTKKWDSKAKEGKGECKDLTEAECKLVATLEWDPAKGKCGPKQKGSYTVTLKSQIRTTSLGDQVKIVSSNRSASLFTLNDCVRLKASDFELLQISTFVAGTPLKKLCGGITHDEDGEPIQENKCAIGHYQVVLGPGKGASSLSKQVVLKSVESPNANRDKCKELSLSDPGLGT